MSDRVKRESGGEGFSFFLFSFYILCNLFFSSFVLYIYVFFWYEEEGSERIVRVGKEDQSRDRTRGL